MIIYETLPKEQESDWTLIRAYSSLGMMISQDETGMLFTEAVDPDFANRTYTETSTPIEEPETHEEELEQKLFEAETAIDILMGLEK